MRIEKRLNRTSLEEVLQRPIVLYAWGVFATKYVSDFMYAFPSVNYKKTYIGEDITLDFIGKNDFIILLSKDKSEGIKKLEEQGLKYLEDFAEADCFFSLLDNGDNDIYIYAENLKDRIDLSIHHYMIRHRILLDRYFLQTFENNDCFMGYMKCIGLKVFSDLNLKHFRFMLYAMADIVFQLLHHQFLVSGRHAKKRKTIYVADERQRDYLLDEVDESYDIRMIEELQSNNLISVMFAATYYDERQNSSVCNIPNELFWIGPGGNTRICYCPEFLDVNVGNVSDTDLDRVWNSQISRIIRLSLINRTYTFCNRKLCTEFKKNLDEHNILQRREICVLEYPNILLSFDHSCNLCCPQCRKDRYVENSIHSEKTLSLCVENIEKSGWLDKCRFFTIGGDGETFLSKHYKKVLLENNGNRQNVVIMTNGTLFTEDIWRNLKGKYSDISFSVSIDAATEETYKKLRGGNWTKLMNNMQLLSKLRKDEEIQSVEIKMVVQRDNYMEMKDFVCWGKRMGFDIVFFSDIWNTGTFSEEEFRDVSMFYDDGKMKPELQEILMDPIFEDPIVSIRW